MYNSWIFLTEVGFPFGIGVCLTFNTIGRKTLFRLTAMGVDIKDCAEGQGEEQGRAALKTVFRWGQEKFRGEF